MHHRANLDLLHLLPSVPRLVEAGCSSGALAAAYRQNNPNCHYLGIEIDPHYAEIAREHCNQVLVADIDTLPWIPPSRRLTAECWVFGDCLEHLKDPWQVVRWVHSHQPDGGVICACIPNSQHWSLQCRLSTGSWIYEDSGLLDRTHIRFFVAQTIASLFEDNGYRLKFNPRHIGPTPSQQVLDCISGLAAASGGDRQLAVQQALPLQYLVVARK